MAQLHPHLYFVYNFHASLFVQDLIRRNLPHSAVIFYEKNKGDFLPPSSTTSSSTSHLGIELTPTATTIITELSSLGTPMEILASPFVQSFTSQKVTLQISSECWAIIFTYLIDASLSTILATIIERINLITNPLVNAYASSDLALTTASSAGSSAMTSSYYSTSMGHLPATTYHTTAYGTATTSATYPSSSYTTGASSSSSPSPTATHALITSHLEAERASLRAIPVDIALRKETLETYSSFAYEAEEALKSERERVAMEALTMGDIDHNGGNSSSSSSSNGSSNNSTNDASKLIYKLSSGDIKGRVDAFLQHVHHRGMYASDSTSGIPFSNLTKVREYKIKVGLLIYRYMYIYYVVATTQCVLSL